MGIPRNKITKGGIEAEDAGHFSAALGEAWRLDRSYTNRDQKVDSRTERETLDARIDYTQIIELEPNQLADRLIRDRRIEPVYIVELRLARWVAPARRQRIIRESHQVPVGEEPVAEPAGRSAGRLAPRNGGRAPCTGRGGRRGTCARRAA